jgi:DNA-binding NarL/FixJ family response regulator
MSTVPVALAVVSDSVVVAEGFVTVLAFGAADLDFDVQMVPPEMADAADVVLYDVTGLHEGVEMILRRLVKSDGATVVAIGAPSREDLTARALELGAVGFLPITAQPEEIIEGIRKAAAGVLGDDGRHTLEAIDQGQPAGLTERETDVLRLITLGLNNTEIAGELFVSINTVKTYIRSLYRKIGATSRAHAVSWAMQRGFARRADTEFGA